MWFKKQEQKKKHPVLTIVVGTLASVGAISIITAGKQFCLDKMQSVAAIFRRKKNEIEDCADAMMS